MGTVEPVYTELPGWGALSVNSALPASLEAYIRRIEEATGVPVKLVSLGPDRAETLMRDTAAVIG
jgi:adenylosuccinate synthase